MLLSIRGATKFFRNGAHTVRALDDVTLSVDAGQFLAVQGPSGCGKSTLLLVAGGLLAPDAGQVTIGEVDPYGVGADQRARLRGANVGFVFQQFHLVPYLTVLENVLAASIASRRSDARQRADELVSRFGLEPRRDHVPGELSTGERQRTALARALFNEPRVVLADEPTGNLDAENAEVVLVALKEFSQRGAVLLVTHDMRAARFADRTVQLRDGRLAAGD